MNEIEKYRQELDSIDKELIDVLANRIRVVLDVGEFKRKNNIKPLDMKRWERVVKTRVSWAKERGIDEAFIREILELIHKQSLKLESDL